VCRLAQCGPVVPKVSRLTPELTGSTYRPLVLTPAAPATAVIFVAAAFLRASVDAVRSTWFLLTISVL